MNTQKFMKWLNEKLLRQSSLFYDEIDNIDKIEENIPTDQTESPLSSQTETPVPSQTETPVSSLQS